MTGKHGRSHPFDLRSQPTQPRSTNPEAFRRGKKRTFRTIRARNSTELLKKMVQGQFMAGAIFQSSYSSAGEPWIVLDAHPFVLDREPTLSPDAIVVYFDAMHLSGIGKDHSACDQ